MSREKRDFSRSERFQLTAMSGLSAKTSSWGGEGSLFGLGGDAAGGGATFFVAFFALRKMGASFLTSSSGADESELSESESMLAVAMLLDPWVVVETGKPKLRWRVEVQGRRSVATQILTGQEIH